MAAAQDPMRMLGQTIADTWRVESFVASGGFGAVYKAVHVRTARPYAIKFLRVDSRAPERVAALHVAFTQEALIVAALEHPAIVRAADLGIVKAEDGSQLPWMALEWIGGVTLDDWLARQPQRRVSAARAVELLSPVLDALAYAHSPRSNSSDWIVHRDLKPKNIMVVKVLRNGRVIDDARLLDFGVAKAMAPVERPPDGRTMSPELIFSPQYAAPEQVQGTATGPWTDVHAMGLILTKMITGVEPYHSPDMAPPSTREELFDRVLREQRPTPAAFDVTSELEPVIARAVALDPGGRYRNAGEFHAALLSALPREQPRRISSSPPAQETPVPVPNPSRDASATASPSAGLRASRWLRPVAVIGSIAIAAIVAGVARGCLGQQPRQDGRALADAAHLDGRVRPDGTAPDVPTDVATWLLDRADAGDTATDGLADALPGPHATDARADRPADRAPPRAVTPLRCDLCGLTEQQVRGAMRRGVRVMASERGNCCCSQDRARFGLPGCCVGRIDPTTGLMVPCF